MKSVLSSEHLLPKTNHSYALNSGFTLTPFRLTRFRLYVSPSRFSVSSKKSSYQDFQEYVKPKRLLPARKLESIGDDTPDQLISRLGSDGSQCLYKIVLRTSSLYGSGLSDLNAGVLICIIDEHGNSILERIPANICQDGEQHSAESKDFDHTHFCRGSLDKFVFVGPQLGPVQAMWISLESGNWRLGGASLTTLSISNDQSDQHSTNGDVQRSVNYKFEVEDVMLGEGSETGMVELRPCQVTESAGIDESEITDLAPSLAEIRRMNEESMKEYADLKGAQLLYNFMLILAGTSISAVTGGEKTTLAFLVGGSCGFLYLLLLQRSVDNLPAPASPDTTQTDRVRVPLLLSAFAFGGAIILLVKQGTTPGLAPTDILAGMLGFLASKLAVVLSALKPMSPRMEDNK